MQANTNKCKQIQTNAYKQNKQQRREPTRPKCQVRSITLKKKFHKIKLRGWESSIKFGFLKTNFYHRFLSHGL